MALATSNRAQLRMIEETNFATTPGTGNSNEVRFTGESLKFAITKSESAEIRPDRQTTDLVPTDASATGGFNFELSYKEYDTLFRAAMSAADWAYYGSVTPGAGQGVGTAFVGTFAANTITAGAAPTGNSAFTTLAKGQWLRVTAPGSDNDGKLVRVSSVTAPTATVITLDTATPLAVGAGVAGCMVSSARLVNGVAETSFTLERVLSDVSQYFAYRGMTLSKMSLKLTPGAMTTGSFEFMGRDGIRANVTAMPGTPVASQTYDVQNGVSGVGYVLEAGVPLAGTFITSLDLSIENSLRTRPGLGVMGAASIGYGSFKVTGTAEIYLKDGLLYDKFLNNTTTSLQVATKDTSGNGYAFQLPAVKYGDAEVTAGGKDQDVKLKIPFTAIRDVVTGKTLIIDRYGA